MENGLPRVEVHREPDGTLFVAHHRPGVPLVYVELCFPGGRAAEPAGRPGLADLAADLANEGPEGMPPTAWRRATEDLAAEIGCEAGEDRWRVNCRCLTGDLEAAGGLFGRLLAGPSMPRGEWKRLVRARRAGAREDWAQPAGVINYLAAVQNAGLAHPRSRPAWEAAYGRCAFDAAAALGRNTLRRGPELCAVIGGDITPDRGFDLLRGLIAALPPGGAGEPAVAPARPSAAAVWLADDPRVDQAFFALGRPGVRAGDPDRVALRLANFLIGGGGFESRLMDAVRKEAGGTYGINSSLPESASEAPFMIRSHTRAPRFGEMLGLVRGALDRVVREGFTPVELDTARRNLHGGLPLALREPRAVLNFALAGIRAGLAPGAQETDWRAYLTTPLEAVNAAARRIIGDGQFRLAVIAPAKAVQDQLAGWGRVEVFKARAMPDRWPAV
ncbi:MAG: insulinase family protein [Planctomycetota bacterium]